MNAATPSSNQTKFCSHCGKPLTVNGTHCSSCGEKVTDTPIPTPISVPKGSPSPSGLSSTGNNIAIIIATIAALVTICGFCCGTTTLAGLLRGKVPHHGAFIRQILGYKEIPTVAYGNALQSQNWYEFPSVGSRPTILLWTPEIDLSYLGLTVIYPDGSTDNIQYEQSSDGEYWELTPSRNLPSGNLYCYVAGSPMSTLYELPAWCFRP